jgi:predicted outer membrane protein
MTSPKLGFTTASLCGVLALSVAACAPPNAQQANLPVVASVGQPSGAPAAGQDVASDESLTPTAFGPISAVDKKLLAVVAQTSIRENTTSEWALERSQNPQIRAAAQTIITQHKDLMAKDMSLSAKLGLPVPDKPSAQMQEGIDRMRDETGTTFENDYVNTLRQGHAEALILLNTVRADTRNSLVRSYSDLAESYVMTHIQMLEKTGDVDFSKLPVPPPPTN